MAMMTFFAPATRSIAPPMPLTILPGIIQLARLPFSSTSSAPSTVRSMCPPRTIANESALLKYARARQLRDRFLAGVDQVGILTSASAGYGPTPSMPFSEWSVMSMPSGTKLATRVGMPMPRLT
jgi:hypothetical protein